jgi:hypothetical protein
VDSIVGVKTLDEDRDRHPILRVQLAKGMGHNSDGGIAWPTN